jgi:peptide/nickel transport system ATP-binding protein
MSAPLLSVENLNVSFGTSRGTVRANENISLEIGEGEILGLIGETGCGKTTLGKAILRLLPGKASMGGKIVYKGRDLLTLPEKEMRKLRGKEIGLMFQNPSACLNPVQSVGKQIAEIYRYHEGMGKKEAEKKAGEMLELVGISSLRGCEYPHQFSGGMQQRVMVSIGLALRPRLLIADEPTKGLDPETKLQIAEMIVGLIRKEKASMLLITHDLELAGMFADRIAVMYAGEIVEIGKTDRVVSGPKHPYTFDLLHSLPEKGLKTVSGQPPSLIFVPSGCRYHPRCSRRLGTCPTIRPALLELEGDHFARCALVFKEEGVWHY